MKKFLLFKEIHGDLQLVEKELNKVVKSPYKTLTEASAHLLHAGGKRLRPAFVLLSGRVLGATIKQLLPIAVALELIHMATLVHDDVIDAAVIRRGLDTVKAKWGNQISMYTGDYLFAKSLILVAGYNNPEMIKIVSDVTMKMCEGELQQIASTFDTEQRYRDYFYRIKRKTALLISASCRLGAMASEAPPEITRALAFYGYHLGMAFQIIDDILDMTADQSKLGKPVGGDLRQGIITIPIIRALQISPQKERLIEITGNKVKSEAEIKEAIEIIKNSGAIEWSFDLAKKFIYKAKKELNVVKDSKAKGNLIAVADFIIERKY